MPLIRAIDSNYTETVMGHLALLIILFLVGAKGILTQGTHDYYSAKFDTMLSFQKLYYYRQLRIYMANLHSYISS